MKYFILIVLVIHCVFAVKDDEWNEYKKMHKKNFVNKAKEDEAKERYDKVNQIIQENNRKHDKGESGFRMGHNKFSCMSDEEKKVYRNLKQTKDTVSTRAIIVTTHPVVPSTYVPSKNIIDLRNVNIPVRDQGDCGSCWAFAGTGLLEYFYAKNNIMADLSEQQFTDCAYYYQSSGCDGGTIHDVFKYYLEKGVNYELKYPYRAVTGSCKFISPLSTTSAGLHPDIGTVKPKFAYRSKPNSETAMAYYVQTYGWTGISLDATDTFMYYESGILSAYDCYGSSANHTVIIVGFGTSSTGIAYWIVRNSWGADWGDKGYIMLERGANCCAMKPNSVYNIA